MLLDPELPRQTMTLLAEQTRTGKDGSILGGTPQPPTQSSRHSALNSAALQVQEPAASSLRGFKVAMSDHCTAPPVPQTAPRKRTWEVGLPGAGAHRSRSPVCATTETPPADAGTQLGRESPANRPAISSKGSA